MKHLLFCKCGLEYALFGPDHKITMEKPQEYPITMEKGVHTCQITMEKECTLAESRWKKHADCEITMEYVWVVSKSRWKCSFCGSIIKRQFNKFISTILLCRVLYQSNQKLEEEECVPKVEQVACSCVQCADMNLERLHKCIPKASC